MTTFSDQEFIHDFLDESSEHLQSMHHNLLALERSISSDDSPIEGSLERVSLVESLFRSAHTLKGLAGMVGLKPAAELNHTLESVFAAIQKTEVELSSRVVDILLASVRMVEAVISTLQNPGVELPDVEKQIQILTRLIEPDQIDPQPGELSAFRGEPGDPEYNREANGGRKEDVFLLLPGISAEVAAHLGEIDHLKIKSRLRQGRGIALATFTPSAEKTERGMHVNQVRETLTKSAELIKAIPLVDGASIRFAFLVATRTQSPVEALGEVEWTEFILPSQAVESPPSKKAAERKVVLPPAGAAAPSEVVPSATTVRVDLGRLDEIMRLVGDLVVNRSRMVNSLSSLNGAQASTLENLDQVVDQMGRNLRDLRQAVMRARMVPLSEVFQRMPLAVRDLTRETDKEIRLVLEGADVEIDKVLVDRLLEPLLHLVRNAISHGIEYPNQRLAAGKPAQGTLTLRGQEQANHVLITVADDGRGIDADRVIAKARSFGWHGRDEAVSDAELLDLIALPGLSTHDEPDLGAGRGVGLDVVIRMVTAAGGILSMQTSPGQGTSFTMRLPLTLAIVDAILVNCGGERYAIPQGMIDEVIEIDPGQIVQTENGEMVPYRESYLNLLHLAHIFHLPKTAHTRGLYGIITAGGNQSAALVVEKLAGMHEVVVRPITDPLIARPGVSGATELGDGSVVLILDLPALFRYAKHGLLPKR